MYACISLGRRQGELWISELVSKGHMVEEVFKSVSSKEVGGLGRVHCGSAHPHICQWLHVCKPSTGNLGPSMVNQEPYAQHLF